MQLLASWRDSLVIFKPANLKLFLLVTLKSLIEGLKVWVKYWWWLIAALIALEYYGSPIPQGYTVLYPIIGADFIYSYCLQGMSSIKHALSQGLYPGFIAVALAITLIYFSLLLSTRASVILKNARYFLANLKKAFYIQLWFLIVPFIFEQMKLLISYLIQKTAAPGFIFTVFASLYVVSLGAITFFFILFLLDSDGSLVSVVKSFWRAILMLLYNIPFCVMSIALLVLLYAIIARLMNLFLSLFPGHDILASICSISVVLLWLACVACVMTNFYIKRTHEQFKLYFQ